MDEESEPPGPAPSEDEVDGEDAGVWADDVFADVEADEFPADPVHSPFPSKE